MTFFWVVIALLCVMSVVLVLKPLWRPVERQPDRSDFDISVFKDQLQELENDLERGTISQEEAVTARTEIQRRLLAADEKRQKKHRLDAGVGKGSLAIGVGLVLFIILGSGILYSKLGSPGYADMPFAERDFDRERQLARTEGVADALAQIQEQLQNDPENVDLWLMLGRTLRFMKKTDEAVEAYEKAVTLSQRHPAVLADYVEIKIFQDRGQVSDTTRKAIEEALTGDPTQLKALFYKGFAQAQAEDLTGAVQTWADLIVMAPEEAPWLAQVRKQLNDVLASQNKKITDIEPSDWVRQRAEEGGMDWRAVLNGVPVVGKAGPALSNDQKQALETMSPTERNEMIRAMVNRLAERLEQEPDDLEGWQRLLKAYEVLGETDKATSVREKIKALQN